jgi:uncharacterized membrane protein HdeD (DUF308 family)
MSFSNIAGAVYMIGLLIVWLVVAFVMADYEDNRQMPWLTMFSGVLMLLAFWRVAGRVFMSGLLLVWAVGGARVCRHQQLARQRIQW